MTCKLKNVYTVRSDAAKSFTESTSAANGGGAEAAPSAPLPPTGEAFILVAGTQYPMPAGVIVMHHDASVFRSVDRSTRQYAPSTRTINAIVLHQSCTSTRLECERALNSKEPTEGVHFIVEPTGVIHQYGDAAFQQYAQTGDARNKTSIGIEEINPYTKLEAPWTQIVDSKTAWRGREVVSTPEALQAMSALVLMLTSVSYTGTYLDVSIPLSFPTTTLSGPSTTNALWNDLSVGGILAHGHRPGGNRACARRPAWALLAALTEAGRI